MHINSMINFNFYKIKYYFKLNKNRGFVLPFTLLICTIILSVSTSISVMLVKELYFSKLSRESQLAYYAADNGLMCATVVDDSYVDPETGLGIFEYKNDVPITPQDVLVKINTERTSQGLSVMTLNDIKCATSEIFNSVTNNYAVSVNPYSHNSENGKSSSFMLRMDLGGGLKRCAKVTVNKTLSYRQIISQGYAECPGDRTTYPVERAVVSETKLN